MTGSLLLLLMTGAPAPAPCMLEVRFGSYAMGIDRRAAARVEALVAAEKAATHVSRSGQGREGEYALCVAAKTPAALAPLARRIRSALPKQPVGPIAISYGVRKFQALKDRRERHRDS